MNIEIRDHLNSDELNLAQRLGLNIKSAVKAKISGLGVADYASNISQNLDLPLDVEMGAWRKLEPWETSPPPNKCLTNKSGIMVPARAYPLGGLNTLEPWTEQYVASHKLE